jgi:hypothetical protein
MPVILGTWNADMERITVQCQPKQTVQEAPCQRNKAECVGKCRPRSGREPKIGGLWSRPACAKSEIPSPKQPQQKGLEGWLKW